MLLGPYAVCVSRRALPACLRGRFASRPLALGAPRDLRAAPSKCRQPPAASSYRLTTCAPPRTIVSRCPRSRCKGHPPVAGRRGCGRTWLSAPRAGPWRIARGSCVREVPRCHDVSTGGVFDCVQIDGAETYAPRAAGRSAGHLIKNH